MRLRFYIWRLFCPYLFITKTSLYNFDSLKHHFYSKTEVYRDTIILKNIRVSHLSSFWCLGRVVRRVGIFTYIFVHSKPHG